VDALFDARDVKLSTAERGGWVAGTGKGKTMSASLTSLGSAVGEPTDGDDGTVRGFLKGLGAGTFKTVSVGSRKKKKREKGAAANDGYTTT
jgi:hypothetical protein